MNLKTLLITIILFATNSNLFASDWTDVLKNDNISAEKKFLKVLSKDSTDFEALVGMIYLSELKKDFLNYSKYKSSFVKNYPNEINLFVYQNTADLEYEDYLKLDVDDKLKLQAKIDESGRLFRNRKFEESRELSNEISSDLEWSLIGPFENINGSGFEVVYAPEANPNKKTYEEYEHKFQNEWLKLMDKTALGGVSFSSYLPKENSHNTFYAKTSFSIDKEQEISLNLTRKTPIKIWIDNQLVFSENENIGKIYDFESVKVSLSPGNHSILVKSAPLPYTYGKNNLFSMGGGYNSYSYDFFNSYNWGSSSSNIGSSFDFLIRLLDAKGEKLKITVEESNDVNVSDQKLKFTNSHFDVIEQIKAKIDNAENIWPYYYLLEKAYRKLNQSTVAEEYLYKVYKENESLFYMKYLLAKTYEKNNKSSEVYLLLENIDHSKTPMFSLLMEKFKSIDEDTDEKLYLSKLKELNDISPSNSQVIRAYVDFYTEKGQYPERKKYLLDLIKKYPSFEDRYEKYLEDENYKPDIYKAETDEEKKEKAMEALASIDTAYNSYNYTTLIKYYKNQEINDSVLYFYDELIKISPRNSRNITNKCEFLYSLEKYDEAKEHLQELLKARPYNTSALTMLGDINFDLKNNDEAKAYYERVLEESAFSMYSYSNRGVLQKIRKITPEKDFSNNLKGKTQESVMKDKKWKDMYEDEDAFIIYYSQDIIFKEYNKIDLLNSIAIKVKTEEGSRELTELDYSHFGNLTTVKVIKENKAEVIPDYSGSYIVFKNLEAGDIIMIEGINKDIGYVKNSVQSLLASEFIISSNYPVYYTKFEMVMPKEEKFYFTYFNMDDLNKEPKVSFKDDYKTYTWAFDDVPKDVFEEGSMYDWELVSFIGFTNVESWNVISDWYLKTTYRKLEFNYELKEILDSLDIRNDKPEVQVDKLYNYITEEIDYSNVPFLQSSFVPKSSNITCSEKIGDCKDVATVMISFLRELGIESYYTLVRTSYYSLLNFPPSLKFDHAIVAYKIGDEFKYLDLTSDYSPSFVLNEMDANAYALLIKEDSKDVFSLPDDVLDEKKNKVTYISDVTFSEDNSINIKSKAEYFGLTCGALKQELNTTPKEELKLILNEFMQNSLLKNPKLVDYKYEKSTEITPSLFIDYDLAVTDFTSNINDLVIFSLPFINPLMESTVFQTEERKHDLYVNFALNADPAVEKVTMTIPESYEMLKLPKDVVIHNEFLNYSLKFTMKDNTLTAEKSLVFLQRIIPKESFEEFRDLYNTIIKTESQKLYYSKM